MEYRRLGSAGMKVSAVSLGAWLTYGGSVENDIATKCIHMAIENGINFIDTADIYARGKAEEVVGEAVKGFTRSDLVISTKVYAPMSDNINDRGLSRKHIMESIDKSLKRLQMDYIDIYYCHRPHPETPVEETVRAMDDLVRQGKILYWGTSMWSAAQVLDAIAAADATLSYRPRVEQPVYNMVEREQVEGELTKVAADYGIGFTVYSPLAQGILTGKYNDGIPEGSRAATVTDDWFKNYLSDDKIEAARGITALAKEMGTTPAALALAWALKHPNVSSVITGASKPEQVIQNIKALDVEITDEITEKIEAILKNKPKGSVR